MPVRLHPFDLGVVGLYLIAITLFGLRFARRGAAKDKSLRGYFLADKTVPWWAIALSIVSAETSTLTIIGTPGLAFAGDFGFLQIVIGYMLGRIVVAAIFLPRYFHGEMLTAYQLIDRRFGHTLHKVTAGLFLLTRAAAEGVRVFAVSIVVGIAIGTGDVLSIAIISALTLLYTFEGGMAAVIWTDVVQMAIYVGGTLVAIWSLGAHVPGGWATIHAAGAAAGKFHMLNFAFNLTTTYTFWAGVLGGTFLTMASHGTDQLMVQRMLAAKNLTESRAALLSSGVVIFVQFALFLLIGVGLWVFYGQHPAALAAFGATDGNRIFPVFIVGEMPTGVAGLLVAAILAAAMSNLSAALNSLSSATVVDFYMGFRPRAGEGERMAVSRASTVFWALVLFAVAVYSVRAGGKGNVVEIGLSIASVAYGCLLGVFLLGVLTRYATEWGAIVGMVTGFAVNLALWQFPGRVLFAGMSVPKVAWTWYVLIGAAVTFAVGLAASMVLRMRKQGAEAAAVAVMIVAALLCAPVARGQQAAASGTTASASIPHYDFSGVSAAINTAIAQKKLPGAVVLIGHDNRVVFEQAYGVRKLAGEPGLDGKPSPAEPMTLDTIFDMASLTKCLTTATAVMQLYEQHKIGLDDPVVKYLPEFAANGKERVTIRELLTHYSGLPPDVDLTDTWGLAAPDKAEGIRRAMNATLDNVPGTKFVYSDVNFITLGAIVEKLSGETLDVYAQKHIFTPLGMTQTRFLSLDRECDTVGFAPWTKPDRKGRVYGEAEIEECGPGMWNRQDWVRDIAPTQHDDQGTKETNPNFDVLLRGTVHDPTTRRMGGVAGHAGVFSDAHDMSLFAQALLDKLLHNTGPFPLEQSTLQLMTSPAQPGASLVDLNYREFQCLVLQSTIPAKLTNSPCPSMLRESMTYPAVAGHNVRGLGWDIDSSYSRPRGEIFPIGSFGHTGFTGTSLWIDPASDSYVILLANSVHPHGNPPISPLRGEVATAAAKALLSPTHRDEAAMNGVPGILPPCPPNTICDPVTVTADSAGVAPIDSSLRTLIQPANGMLTGVNVLEQTNFKALTDLAAQHHNHFRVGLLTNQTGVDAEGRHTIDVLRNAGNGVNLVRLFSPEHGLFSSKDSTTIGQEADAASGLPVVSLYGPKDADKRPKPADLRDLDAVVIDLQDAGVRFYTYESVVGYFLEASACEAARGHALEIVVLDRPNPIGGLAVQGPVSDTSAAYINYMAEPVRNGMTLGELAQYMRAEHSGACGARANLTVVPMKGWQRSEFFDQTGLNWINPSPNLRSIDAATLYPGLGMLDYANVSVGRGTDTPFEIFGAGVAKDGASKDAAAQPRQSSSSLWFDGKTVAAYLTARHIPGVTFAPTRFAVADDANHYPYHGQTIEGVRLTVTDRAALDSPELGIEILSALHHLYPMQFRLDKAAGLVANTETMATLVRGEDPRTIAAAWAKELEEFKARRAKYLIYP